jgi:hypothetical protein
LYCTSLKRCDMTLNRRHVQLNIAVLFIINSLMVFVITPAHSAGTRTFTTVQDFSSCESGISPTLNQTAMSTEEDGEIALRSPMSDDFNGPAVDSSLWRVGEYIDEPSEGSSPDVSVAGGKVNVISQRSVPRIGSYLRSAAAMPYGAVEGLITFSKGWYQHFGLATPGFIDVSRFAIFSTGEDKPGIFAANTLYARVNNEDSEIMIPLGPIPTTPVRLRIERLDAGGHDLLRFYSAHNGNSYTRVDEISMAGYLAPKQKFTTPMYAHVSNKSATGVNLNGDPGPAWALSSSWIRSLPYTAASGSYTSCPFYVSLQQRQTWGTVSFTRTANPPGGSVSVEFRTSDDAITWSPYTPVASGAVPGAPPGIYAQYRVTLSRGTSPLDSPRLTSISIAYNGQSNTPPQVIPASGPVGTRFLVVGDGFDAGALLSVQMDNRTIGQLPANPNGGFAFYIDSSLLDIGPHNVEISGAGRSTIQLTFVVTVGTPGPPAPGGTQTFQPVLRAFLPVVQR